MLKIFIERKTLCSCFESPISSSFIQTILLVLELHQIMCFYARGLYRQSGISPCPEDISIQLYIPRIPLMPGSCNSLRGFRKHFGSPYSLTPQWTQKARRQSAGGPFASCGVLGQIRTAGPSLRSYFWQFQSM